MKLIYASILLFNAVIRGEDVKKTNSRDVNDASGDYALSKIPVYLIQNTAISEGKVPVAVIPGAYPPATFYSAPTKEAKQHKYGFYAPYKTPEVTPIHEPQSEGYAAHKLQQAYTYTDLNQKPDYNDHPSYKVSIIGKDYQTSTSFVKYETTPKNILEKHQSLSNGNIYASLAPVYGYPNHGSAGYVAPKKVEYQYTPQYYIKYIPVPYHVPQDQYVQNIPDTAYITPKPIAAKQPEPEVSTPAYTYSNDAQQYAASYVPSEDQYPEYKYIQPEPALKNIYTKKYAPTSYLVASSIGKGVSSHYAANIQHASPAHEPYTTKLAPVPLPVDKYVVQDNPTPEEKYSESGYAYVLPNADTKYKPLFNVAQYYDNAANQHYYKKDVVSSTKSYESSTSKL